jgi:hypothetical protein
MRQPRSRAFATVALAAAAAATVLIPPAAIGGRTADGTSLPAATTPPGTAADANAVDLAHRIQAETTARYGRSGRPNLVVTEASSTAVIESFTLLTPALDETRVVPAANGIYFAICPRRATCPNPSRRFARPPSDFLVRRAALELAVRTFADTSADVVAVSLPTRRFILFIAERDELLRAVDAPAATTALAADPAAPPDPALRVLVDQATRPRIFVPVDLEPTPTGRDTVTAIPLWPSVTTAPSAARRTDVPVRLAIDVSDNVGNERTLVRTLHLNHQFAQRQSRGGTFQR